MPEVPDGRATILYQISLERDRQEALKSEGRFKFTCADPEMATGDKSMVLGEEYGEVCTAALEATGLSFDLHQPHLRKELIQVAAVAVAWIEALDKDTELARKVGEIQA